MDLSNTGEPGWALRYNNGSDNVGTLMNNGDPTSQFTIVVRGNGTVATAYPGW
jgi:hypothetical protein